MWSYANLAQRPLTLSERIFLVEQQRTVEVKAHQNLPAIKTDAFGSLGPFVRGKKSSAPLYAVPILAAEMIAFPVLPKWLSPNTLRTLIRAELAGPGLCPCCDDDYIELTTIFVEADYNAWSEFPDPYRARAEAVSLMSDYTAIRRRKIAEVDARLLQYGAADVSALSKSERNRLCLVALDYIANLRETTIVPGERVEDLVAPLKILNFREYYKSLEAAQQLYTELEDEDDDGDNDGDAEDDSG